MSLLQLSNFGIYFELDFYPTPTFLSRNVYPPRHHCHPERSRGVILSAVEGSIKITIAQRYKNIHPNFSLPTSYISVLARVCPCLSVPVRACPCLSVSSRTIILYKPQKPPEPHVETWGLPYRRPLTGTLNFRRVAPFCVLAERCS